jgi:outer membrane receptor protein involved in Fe transport
MRVRGKFLIAMLVCLLAAGSLMAQSTRGGLQGTVTDEGGQPLPGVNVLLTSPNMQGQKTAVTEADGTYRFVLLPPGTYKAVFSLPGYQKLEQENIRVVIATIFTLNVTLKSAFTEEVVVSGEAPLVDTTSTTLGTNLPQSFYADLPIQRNYASVASVTPGSNTDASGTTFYGSTGAENAYYIDGVNTTGVELADQGKRLNFEFIQEVQVKTGGYSAEYGRNTGGIISVITKSGGNEFHGDVFGYYDSDSLEANLKAAPATGGVSGTRAQTGFTREDYGVDVGGYIIKDALWFFTAYDYVKEVRNWAVTKDFTEVGGPPLGQSFDDTVRQDLWAAKLTWRISDNHSLAAAAFGDPRTRSGPGVGAGAGFAGPPTSYMGTADTGGTDGTADYNGVFGENWVVSARYAMHREKLRQGGPGANLVDYIDNTDPLHDGTTVHGWPGSGEAGLGFESTQDFARKQYNADVSYFVGDFFGQHEFKAGYEWEHITVKNLSEYSGGQLIWRYGSPGDYYYAHEYFLKEKVPVDQITPDLIGPRAVNTKADNYAMYIQDRWQPTSNLTFNLGVRLDRQKLYNMFGGLSADIKNEWGPRLGFVWDFMGNGKSKLFGHIGRFYETVPMDIVIRSFGGEIDAFIYNLSDDPADIQPGGWVGPYSRIRGGGISRVDPDIKGQYITEYVLGAQYELAPNVSLSVKGIYRDLGRVIEDALSQDGDYFIGNPGMGTLSYTYDASYWYSYPGGPGECLNGDPNCHLHHVPAPKRTFTGIEVTLQKRFSDNFQLIASALYSRLSGNYDGTFQASTGQLDPNLNSAYDYYDFSVNNNGYLSNDRRQQFKVDGSYRFDWGLTFGLSAYYETGTPVTAMDYHSWYRNWEMYLSRRGAFGRVNSDWEADVHFGYPIKVGGDVTVNLLLDIFRVFNNQMENSRSLRYDYSMDYQVLDPHTGMPYPPLTPDNALIPVGVYTEGRPATNASFNTSNGWTLPRQVRFGVRISF